MPKNDSWLMPKWRTLRNDCILPVVHAILCFSGSLYAFVFYHYSMALFFIQPRLRPVWSLGHHWVQLYVSIRIWRVGTNKLALLFYLFSLLSSSQVRSQVLEIKTELRSSFSKSPHCFMDIWRIYFPDSDEVETTGLSFRYQWVPC